MELYLIRHAQSVGNVSNMIQGGADLELTEEGERQAELLAGRLKDLRFDVLYSSPMKRARATAEAIARAKDLPVETAPWLAEMDTGHLSGLPREEVARRYPSFLNRSLGEWYGFPGGETNEQFWGRVTAGYDELKGCHGSEDCAVAIVSHIATLNVILYHALGLSLVPYPRFALASASLSRIVFRQIGGEELPILSFLNDTSHLRPTPDPIRPQ